MGPIYTVGSQYGTRVGSWGTNIGPIYTVGSQYGTRVGSWGTNMGPMCIECGNCFGLALPPSLID